jgi:5'-deoxy-5'-methylthioadenosine phosphorylase
MAKLAIIGGSGLASLAALKITRQQVQHTPYGEPSGVLTYGVYADKEIIFMPRHGNPHVLPPHKINYRANIWALKDNGITNIIGVNAVGGITEQMLPGSLVIPNQIIDYTWSRAHTFFDDGLSEVTHIDFTHPYDEELRQALLVAADTAGLDVLSSATYGATQGPRLETAAEIRQLKNDGCDIVGMTGMPEASLAKELEIRYASISIVANWGAGITEEALTMEAINAMLTKALGKVHTLLGAAIPALG